MQLSLKCLNCGAALTIPATVSQMACGYCGVVQQVQREGGGVWLSLEKALADLAFAELGFDQLPSSRSVVGGAW